MYIFSFLPETGVLIPGWNQNFQGSIQILATDDGFVKFFIALLPVK